MGAVRLSHWQWVHREQNSTVVLMQHLLLEGLQETLFVINESIVSDRVFQKGFDEIDGPSDGIR